MAFVLFLQVSWICLLIINGIGVSHAIGDEYRLQAASRNLLNHVDDFPNSLSFDEGTEQVSRLEPSTHFYTSFSKPSVTQPQNLAIPGQSPPTKLSAPREKAVAGESMKWESKRLEPISFPTRHDKVSLIPAAVHSQFIPLDPNTNRKPLYHDFAGTRDLSKKVPSKAFTSLSWPAETQTHGKVGVSTVSFPKGALSPSPSRGGSSKTQFLQEGALHYNYGNAGASPDHSLKQDFPLLYPSVHAKRQDDSGAKDYGQSDNFAMWAPPSYRKPSAVPVFPVRKPSFQSTDAKSSAKDRMMGFPFSGAGRLSRWPQNFVTSNQKIKVLEGVSQPALSSLKRIVHTKNGYKRGRVLFTKAAYTPEYEPSQMMDAMERPAQDSETWRKH